MRNPACRIDENKEADQLCGNRTADQRLCFRYLGHRFFILFYRFFRNKFLVGGRNKNKIPSDHFQIELKAKKKYWKMVRMNFIFNFVNLVVVEKTKRKKDNS